MIIDWTKFDHIFCIHFLPFREREQHLKEEFERVDLLSSDRFSFEYTVPSVYDTVIYDYMTKIGKNRLISIRQTNLVLATYRILQYSKIMNYDRILILEDDIAFLNDKEEIQKILDKLPDTYDICLFDKFKDAEISMNEYQSYINNKVNDYYSRYKRLKSCGCYSLSKSCIERFVNLYESMLMITDEFTSLIDFKDKPLQKIFSVKNLACQISYDGCSNVVHGGRNCIHDVYKQQGLNYQDYNVGNFTYGDLK